MSARPNIWVPYPKGLLPGQKSLFHVDPDVQLDICIYQGGFGSGKTWGGSLLGLLLAQKYPGKTGLVVAKTWPMLRDTTLQEYFNHLDAMKLEHGRHYTYNVSSGILAFPIWGGSKILFRHMQTSWKVKSLTVSWFEMEEASELTEADFNMLLGRLRQGGVTRWRGFGHTNPQAAKGWIYKRCVEKGGKKIETRDDGSQIVMNFRRVIAPTKENVHNPPTFLASMKDQYDPEYYRINVEGQDGDYASGLVTRNWSNLNERECVYNPDLVIHLSCDFNVDPMMWTLSHVDYNAKEHYFFEEIVVENTTVEATCKKFIERYSSHRAGIIINGDASGNNRHYLAKDENETAYTQMLNALASVKGHGFPNVRVDVREANPSIQSRVAAWNGAVCSETGVRKVYVNPKTCPYLYWNIHNVRYKTGTSDIWEPTQREKESSRDMKFYKHIWDAASYQVEMYNKIIPIERKVLDIPPPELIFDV